MTILTINRKEFERKVRDGKIYKVFSMFITNMFPSDPTGSLDDFFDDLRRVYGRYFSFY